MAGVIRSRYQPRAVVGAGAQGKVLCARDLVHDRLVALKIRRVRSPADREELLKEARTLLGLRPHPGVPLVREDFFAGGRYHIVMDWVEGIDLARLITDAGPGGLPYHQVLTYLTQVADALDHLHSHEPPIVHNDVKPANIVVDASGRAVLVDFGISTAIGRRQGRSGTAGYLAPEIAAGEPGRPASDIFSLAVTAYFAFTGELPEPGAQRPWRGVPASLVPRVEAGLARGLALDPVRRPPSARALVEMLAPQSVPHNLPAPMTRFVGRHGELGGLAKAMNRTRLLTLVGSGGVGKTRLATEMAADIGWTYPDGVWLVELASVGSDFVPAVVAKVLGVREEPGRSLLETVADRLRDRQLLLVLDNCEHVLDAAASVAEALLKESRGLRVLATSRQPLDVFGEVVHRVPTLSFPETAGPQLLEQIRTYEAVELFCERANAAHHPFDLTPETASGVTTVCAVLDGIPLALEMAASRLRELSLSELTASLGAALELRGARTAPTRQRTLAATVAWSYELLAPPMASLFRRLCVFAGTFNLEAAEAVCADIGGQPSEVHHLLESLVERSMVVPLESDDGRGERYRLLESLRMFAEERAAEAGELEWLVDRHLEWFLSTAEGVDDKLFGPGEPEALNRLEAENDNLRTALENALGAGLHEAFLRLGVALSRFWNVRGYWVEGRRWLEAALGAFPEGPASLQAKALAAAAVLSERQADFPAAVAFGDQALELARAVQDRTTAAEALDALSSVAQEQGQRERADSLLRECLEEWRASGAVRGVVSSFAGALGEVGWTAVWLGHFEDASRLFQEALEVAGELGIARARSYAFLGLAAVAQAEGRLADARRFLGEATSISEQLGDTRFLGREAHMRGLLAWDGGDLVDADFAFQGALRAATEGGDQVLLIRVLEGLARVTWGYGDSGRAATLFGAAAALREALPWPVAPADEEWYEAALAQIRAALGGLSFDRAWHRGMAMQPDEAVAVARDQSPGLPVPRSQAV